MHTLNGTGMLPIKKVFNHSTPNSQQLLIKKPAILNSTTHLSVLITSHFGPYPTILQTFHKVFLREPFHPRLCNIWCRGSKAQKPKLAANRRISCPTAKVTDVWLLLRFAEQRFIFWWGRFCSPSKKEVEIWQDWSVLKSAKFLICYL